MKRTLMIPYTFVLMNWAAVVGLYNFVLGRADVWMKYRVSRPDWKIPIGADAWIKKATAKRH